MLPGTALITMIPCTMFYAHNSHTGSLLIKFHYCMPLPGKTAAAETEISSASDNKSTWAP